MRQRRRNRLAHDGEDEVLLDVRDTNLLGAHNYENIMCAIAVSMEDRKSVV